MSRNLLLIRHAQAHEKSFDEPDKDRELTNVGISQAMQLGNFLKNKKMHVHAIISSSAARALQTAHLVGEQMSYSPEDIILNETLYEASVRIYLHAVNVLRDSWENVAIVGHNPSIMYLAEYLTGESLDAMSPCTMVKISFPIEKWEMVSEKTGSFALRFTPEKF